MGSDYFIQTFAHDQLKKDNADYETLLSFNKTFGSKHNLKIFKSSKLENLEIEKQMFFEFDGEERDEITTEYELRQFMYSKESTPILYLEDTQTVGVHQI